MNIFNRNRTFRPKKNHRAGTKRHELHKHARATLGTGGSMRAAVVLPMDEDLNEWLAVNTVDFFNEISLLYGTITEFCTADSCPVMSAGPKFEYLWADGTNIRTPINVPAPEYVDLLMTWVEGQLNNEEVFPTQVDVAFPRQFATTVKVIFKRLFRIYAHIYFSHFEKIQSLGAEAHLNTCFKHFIFFVLEFDLVERRELAPLDELIRNLTEEDGSSAEVAAGASS